MDFMETVTRTVVTRRKTEANLLATNSSSNLSQFKSPGVLPVCDIIAPSRVLCFAVRVYRDELKCVRKRDFNVRILFPPPPMNWLDEAMIGDCLKMTVGGEKGLKNMLPKQGPTQSLNTLHTHRSTQHPSSNVPTIIQRWRIGSAHSITNYKTHKNFRRLCLHINHHI